MRPFVGDGFSVTLLGRSGLRYCEGDRTMHIDGEMLVGPPHGFVVYTNTIGRWEGAEEPVGDDEKRRIIANLAAAFRFEGLAVDFEPRL